ncbi:nitroreductase/quinone reductase family protein [Micromonospora sp. NPDC049171]|uniref:nitroreductase/quinone reductase family protein n=1 Tax=Micromonospora sp. NPDC049171 TaxID=3155770 RepID=UPI0033CF8C21
MTIRRSWRIRMYRGGRPGRLARVLNRIAAAQHSSGFLAPPAWVTLEVVGRRSGRTVAFPLVMTVHDGERYVVSMLGRRANWVANVRAADGAATLRRGRREPVRLVEVDVAERASILREYLAKAPGARPHFPIDRHSSLAEFTVIAPEYPVFLIRAAVP